MRQAVVKCRGRNIERAEGTSHFIVSFFSFVFSNFGFIVLGTKSLMQREL